MMALLTSADSVENTFRQIETGLSLRQCHDSTGTLFTQHQVCFPVSQALTCINNRWA